MNDDSAASPDDSKPREDGAPGNDIEITPAMIEAAWGSAVSGDDLADEKERVYAGIFAAMLIAGTQPALRRISRVLYKGVALGERSGRR
jgi:hypothetical protein